MWRCSNISLRSSKKNDGGFTLLEMLVTLAILAVLATLVYSSFSASVNAMEQVNREMDPYRQARAILSRMSEEISMAYWPGENAFPEGLFVGEDRVVEDRPWDRIQFTSLSHFRYLKNETSSDLTLVEYGLQTNPQGRPVLLYRSRPNLFGLSEAADQLFVLGEGIHGLDFRYFDGKDWQDEWLAGNSGGLPLAVQIEIFFSDARGQVRSLKTWVKVPLSRTKRLA